MHNSFYRGSLALRVLAVSVVVFALPLLIYFIIVFHYSYEQRLSETALRLRDLGRSRALQLSQQIAFDLQELNILSETLAAHFKYLQVSSKDDQGKVINPILEDVAKGGSFDAVFFLELYPGGKAVCVFSSDRSMIGFDYTSYDLVTTVSERGSGAVVSYGSASFNKRLYVGKLVYSPMTHKPIGILGMMTSATTLINDLLRTEDTSYPVNFSLLTKDNTVFASGNPELTMRVLQREEEKGGVRTNRLSPHEQIKIELIKKGSGAFEIEWKGKRSIAIEVPIEGTDLKLLLDADERVIYANLYSHLIHVLGIFFVLLAFGGWAALWLTQRMSQPLNRLMEVMNRVSEGDLTARFEPDRMGFEINSIGEIFNQTLLSLRHQMHCAENERVQKETLKRELNIGQEIQMSILPHEWPNFPGVELAARYVPAKEVGGDFYDIFAKKRSGSDLEDVMITVADASGKGISACLYSLGVRSMLRSFWMDHDDVATIIEKANNLFCEDTGTTGMFVTALVAIYSPDSRRLHYVSAGHNPAFLLRADGTIEPLMTHGIAMGVEKLKSRSVLSSSVELGQGDLVLFYTDGITEAHSIEQELFGEERLVEFLRKERRGSAEQIADRLLATTHHFAKGAPQHDDITVMVLRLTDA